MQFLEALESLKSREYLMRTKWRTEEEQKFKAAQDAGQIKDQTFQYSGKVLALIPGHVSIMQFTPGGLQPQIAHWLPTIEDFAADDWELA